MSGDRLEVVAAVYELRIYPTYPGKLAGLADEFREPDGSCLRKHGIRNVALIGRLWTIRRKATC